MVRRSTLLLFLFSFANTSKISVESYVRSLYRMRRISSHCLRRINFTFRHRPTACSYIIHQSSVRVPTLHRNPPIGRMHSSTVDQILQDDVTTSAIVQNYTEYEKWVRRLYATNMFHPVKLGLTNIQQLHKVLGDPLDKTCVVHIAGTNGKGSVAMKIARTLEYSNPNLKIGLFCSPHVSTFRERMQVNGEYISEEEVVNYLPQIYAHCKEHDIPATFFEITTALAAAFYAARNVDVVVLETGLGGRLDATNVVVSPALSVITSIGLEHTRILGDTIEKIALEKGGIIKAGRPVLVGPNVPHTVLRQCAMEKKSSGYYTCEDVLGGQRNNQQAENDSIHGNEEDYDIVNARIAKAALILLQQSHPQIVGHAIPDDVIHHGTSQRPPCRFELIQTTTKDDNPLVILDVAHNPDAMEYLSRKLHKTYPDSTFRVVVGMSSDKDMTLCGKLLMNIVQNDATRIHLVQAAHPRASTLEEMLNATNLQSAHYDLQDRSLTNQIHKAMDMARAANVTGSSTSATTRPSEIVIICGSVFLMSEAREALGMDEPRDSPYIAELAGAGFRYAQERYGNSSFSNSN